MNLVLCGFMGSGKSTVGKILSESLNIDFIDLDDYIVEKRNMNIPYIFENYGEKNFRKSEEQAVKNVSKLNNIIISLGGGTVINEKNVLTLKQNGKIVFLNISAEECYNRLKNNKSRPLLNTDDKFKKIELMLSERLPFYQKAADYIIDVNNKNSSIIAQEVLKIIKNNKIIDNK